MTIGIIKDNQKSEPRMSGTEGRFSFTERPCPPFLYCRKERTGNRKVGGFRGRHLGAYKTHRRTDIVIEMDT